MKKRFYMKIVTRKVIADDLPWRVYAEIRTKNEVLLTSLDAGFTYRNQAYLYASQRRKDQAEVTEWVKQHAGYRD